MQEKWTKTLSYASSQLPKCFGDCGTFHMLWKHFSCESEKRSRKIWSRLSNQSTCLARSPKKGNRRHFLPPTIVKLYSVSNPRTFKISYENNIKNSIKTFHPKTHPTPPHPVSIFLGYSHENHPLTFIFPPINTIPRISRYLQLSVHLLALTQNHK